MNASGGKNVTACRDGIIVDRLQRLPTPPIGSGFLHDWRPWTFPSLFSVYEAALDSGSALDIKLVLQRVVDLARLVVRSIYAALGAGHAKQRTEVRLPNKFQVRRWSRSPELIIAQELSRSTPQPSVTARPD